jgi:hypothetical protein
VLSVQIQGIRATFFSAELEKRVAIGVTKSLSKCGAFVRTASKSSLRYAKKSAGPGSPPKVHRTNSFKRTSVNRKTGASITRQVSPLKDLIYFAFDPVRESVVVGPMEFKSRKNRSYKVPAILEGGGTVTGITPAGKTEQRKYRGNPFMKPALDKEMPKFQQQFANLMG